ncbi:MAG: type 1 glutamine amidotransferase domain-containing protein, partial [Lentisphaeria bacterium]|nr:type 1 glutamine amidotransferase domain-containing protein [Lentisphaeria bacterium]
MNPLLIVTTSHGRIGVTGQRTGVWLEEFVGVYRRFLDRGIPVVVASPRGGEVPLEPRSLRVPALSPEARRFLAQGDPALSRTIPLKSICHHDFDAVFYPGGAGPMWDLAADLANARLLGAFFDCGKVVGALCHGTAALLKARRRNGDPVIRNRRVTGLSDAEELHNG